MIVYEAREVFNCYKYVSMKNSCEGGSQTIATFPTQFLAPGRREPALKEAEVDPVFIETAT